MSTSLALIQLISEQTMPNLLPVLRLKPAQLIHLATPRTVARSAWIVEAARQAGVLPKVAIIPLSAMPAVPETFNAVKRAILQARAEKQSPIINFTGGTKLMSIGAFAAALNQNHKAPSLYVDTEDETFVDGRTGDGLAELLEDDFSFTPLQRVLTVNTIAVANGRERVTGGRGWRPFLPLARHLVECGADEHATHTAVFGEGKGPHRREGFLPNGQQPNSPADWLALLSRELTLPARVAELAVEADLLLQGTSSNRCRLPVAAHEELRSLADAVARKQVIPDYDRRRIAATELLQRSLSFLTGGWWEVVVVEAAERSGCFRDLRWSANVGQRAGADLEEDILAVDGVQVVCISCKRGGAKSRLLPQLEELNARARSLGGNFTRRFLAVQQPLKGSVAANLRQRTAELGIRLLTPDDLTQPSAFARTRGTV